MKQLFLIIICFFYYVEIYAKCAGNGLFVFPQGRNINQNSIFVLNGYPLKNKTVQFT